MAMDWDTLHAMAKAASPPEHLPPKKCWIAVLHHDKDLAQQLDEFDFVWMKGHKKIQVAKIRASYQGRFPTLADFDLKFKDQILCSDDTVRHLDHYQDGFIIIRAMEKSGRTHLRDIAQPSVAPFATSTDMTKQEPATPLHSNNVKQEEGLRSMASSTPSNKRQYSVGPQPSAVPCATSSDMTKQEPATPPHSNNVKQEEGLTSVAASTSSNRRQYSVGPQTPEHVPDCGAVTPSCDSQGREEPSTERSPESQASTRPATPEQASFDPETVFKRDPTPGTDGQDIIDAPIDRSVRTIIEQDHVAVLEAGVAKSLEVLGRLKHSFAPHVSSSDEAKNWTDSINKLIPQAARQRTVVGVVGNTGAGKSSVINAMLDEERLVPTNCMRACTAVVTEMSWNDSNDPSSKYRAEIEFISRADWEKELGILLGELLTDSGTVSSDVKDSNSDAGIAWAKFHAVYPKKPKDVLPDCKVSGLMAEDCVKFLGTTKRLATSEASSFYRELQRYVDSKEKVNKDKKKKKGDAPEIEFWPLIKVVKIYAKSPALSTGAVVVDLPGVHDSNAARAAVAQGYMKQCTGLWIVAPINRAVDDKAAKTLLGEQFKRQLKYDGVFSNVTFICSKTDDISITEASESLQLGEEMDSLYEQEQEQEREVEDLENKIKELKESQAVYKAARKEISDETDTWEDLRNDLDDGKTVFAPLKKQNKRKRKGSDGGSRKRRQGSNDDSDDDFVVSDGDEASANSDSDSDDEGVEPPREPLTEDTVKDKLKDLKQARKSANEQVILISEKMKELAPATKAAKEKIARIRAEMSRMCITGRNEYSRTAIQQDFAAGIKELDQENAEEEDEDNFDPDQDLRDYEKVAEDLPVFCVSSRAYQKMCGRLKKDDDVPGFQTPEETQIPQLQEHCKTLTVAGRVQSCRSFLLNICQLLTTFGLWASDDGSGIKMTDEDKRKQVQHLEKRLQELENGLDDTVEKCVDVMKREMKDQIFQRYPEVIDEAAKAAPGTAAGWGAHRDQGGLVYMTYKAIVRRNGVYTSGTAGHRDFNAALAEPVIKKLASGWERAFQHRLPKAVEAYAKNSGTILRAFHEHVEQRARQNGVSFAILSALKNQIYAYEQLFQDFYSVLLNNMNELQREANRDFTPTIMNNMINVYDMCTDERGPGSYKRMKHHMSQYVDQHRHDMFQRAVGTVTDHLNSMCKDLRKMMENRAQEIFLQMRGDYMRVLGGVHVDPTAGIPRAERLLRNEVLQILRGVDAEFEPIADGRLEEQQADEELPDKNDERFTFVKQGSETADAPDEEESPYASAKDHLDTPMQGHKNETVDTITEPSPCKAPGSDKGDVEMQIAHEATHQSSNDWAFEDEL